MAKPSDSPLPKLVQYALKGTTYELIAFPDDMRDAAEIAERLQLPAGQVFKTLVVIKPDNRGKPYLVMIPADQQLNLKQFAKAVNEKKAGHGLPRTGRAANRPASGRHLGAGPKNSGFQVYLDQSAQNHAEIYVSGGQRGLDVRLAVTDLVRITGARWANAA
ncbi:MAG: Cys-tRNA(Pro) deacylase [Chloroflexi bacterium]|nr:Cys-tRNA(Pro) deacylase [Chloroflexota bacterium]